MGVKKMKNFVVAIFLLIITVFIIWTISSLPDDYTYSQKQILYMIPVFLVAISFYLMVSI